MKNFNLIFGVLFLVLIFTVSCEETEEVKKTKACFSFIPTSKISVEDEVTFTNCSENAESYEWNFGDNSQVLTTTDVIHVFDKFGVYTVTLTATNGNLKDTVSKTVTITNKFLSKFTVDIPSSISRESSLKSASNDDFSGKDIYENVSNFINVGESAAEFIEEIMIAISSYGLNKPMEFNFTSDDDNRVKNVVVVDGSEFEGVTWQHQLTITDAANENNDDGGKALQVFWNTNPIKGMTLLNPGNWNGSDESGMKNAIFKVEYSEAKENGYDAEMTVSIANWEQDMNDRFHMDNLKMFVGKVGNIVDVYGNSNHPDAYLFLEEPKGFSWAFVASGTNDDTNIGVAEVGLPPSLLDESDRKVLLEDYSIKNVFTEQITTWVMQKYPDADSVEVAIEVTKLLVDTEAPGFFNSNGFVQGGTAPSDDYNELVSNIDVLAPYNPLKISQLKISFK